MAYLFNPLEFEEVPLKSDASIEQRKTARSQTFLMMFGVFEYLSYLMGILMWENANTMPLYYCLLCLVSVCPLLMIFAIASRKPHLLVIYLFYNVFLMTLFWISFAYCVYLSVELPQEYVDLAMRTYPDVIHSESNARMLIVSAAIISLLAAVLLHIVRFTVYKAYFQFEKEIKDQESDDNCKMNGRHHSKVIDEIESLLQKDY